ncbi:MULTISPECIES: class F sortase [Corynebacterium]|uniref:class F sortase n=1 Tax=Corynebacterium TaxID=1716 RepID=UPI0008A88B81|nr:MULTISPECIES: class F sortase [Corynebacterium]MBC6762453.1 class F sortase [Corynebacterium sp. LK27]MDK7110232.1 class F sortase [Corynebacterium amycolatum]MDK7145989.1 class F sortase [Corynebacterium amycolatum]OHR32937.1 sortase [Corynebacterium sp. HMSC074C03]
MTDQFGSDETGKEPGNAPGFEPSIEAEAETGAPDHVDAFDQDEDQADGQTEDLQDVPWWKQPRVYIAAIALIGVIALLVIAQLNRNDSALDGAQENLPTPAQGSRGAVHEMEMLIDGKSAPIDFVQLTDQGSLIPPTDISRLGWYSASAIPGEEGAAGSSVITGHVNEVDQGDGYAARFADLKAGDTVTVKVDGESRDFTVSKDPIQVVKGAQMPESVNDAVGENRLVLITCGGEFVGGTLGYADNIIVEAIPVR